MSGIKVLQRGNVDIDPAEFRKHFSNLSDEALIAISRDDLVDSARLYYDGEIATRGLERDSASADERGAATMNRHFGNDPELVTIAEFTSAEDTRVAQSFLESGGIPSFFADEYTLAAMGAGGLGYFELRVPAAFAEQARVALETPLSDEELAAQAEAAGPPQLDRDEDSEPE